MASASDQDSGPPPSVLPSQTLPRVFISHSSGDNAFGYAITEKLRAAGIDTWYDSHGGPDSDGIWRGGIPPATYWQSEIVRELTQRRVFVVILSPKSVASTWVQDEISLAWSQKNSADLTHGKVIVPLLRETCAVPPLVSLVQYVNYRPEADQEQAWAELLYAVQFGHTRPAPGVELGPPFDLGLLPPLERFIGREHEVTWIMDRLAITSGGAAPVGIAGIAGANGLAGIGKTALATEVVRRLMIRNVFPDGIAVISCKGQTNAELLLRHILARFTVGRREPDEFTLATLADRMRQLLARKRALVVLDGVEQALHVREVLQPLRASGVAVLLTSRAELPAVPIRANLMLDTLPSDDALDLFAEYYGCGTIQALGQDEQVAAKSIVETLGRHPLAIKLAAANAATLKRPLNRVADELTEQPRRALFLQNGEEAVRFVLSSSYEALSAPAQHLFILTAAFATSDFGRAAILNVAHDLGHDSVDLQPSNHSHQYASDEIYSQALHEIIVMRMADPAILEGVPEESDRERVRLHPLVEAYARQRFEQEDVDKQSEALRAVATWYRVYTDASDYAALEVDERNIYGAIEWSHAHRDDELTAHLCNGMEVFWRVYARTDERSRYLQWGLEATDRLSASGDRSDRLRHALMELAYSELLQLLGESANAKEYASHSLESFTELGDARGQGGALATLGDLAMREGDIAAARDYYERNVAILTSSDDLREEGVARSRLGELALREGDVTAARTNYERYLQIMRAVHDLREEGVAHLKLGDLALYEGDTLAARTNYQRYLHVMRDARLHRSEAIALSRMGDLALLEGDIDTARSNYQRFLEVMQELRDTHEEGIALSKLGILEFREGKLVTAHANFRRYLDIMRQFNDLREQGIALASLGSVALQRNDLATARTNFEHYLQIMHDVHDLREEGVARARLGDLALHQGDVAAASEHYERYLEIARAVRARQNEAEALSKLGDLAIYEENTAAAQTYYQHALEILRAVRDLRGEGMVLAGLGDVALHRGNLAIARDFYQRFSQIVRDIGDRAGQGLAFIRLGDVAQSEGDSRTAWENFQQAINVLRAVDDRHGESVAHAKLGDLAQVEGDFATAKEQFALNLEIWQTLGDRRQEAVAMSKLGDLALQEGNLVLAKSIFLQVLEIVKAVHDLQGESAANSKLGDLALRERDLALALTFFQRALTIARESGDLRRESLLLTRLGRITYEDGNFGLAEQFLRRALTIDRMLVLTRNMAVDHTDLARVYRKQGRYNEALDHESQARAIEEAE